MMFQGNKNLLVRIRTDSDGELCTIRAEVCDRTCASGAMAVEVGVLQQLPHVSRMFLEVDGALVQHEDVSEVLDYLRLEYVRGMTELLDAQDAAQFVKDHEHLRKVLGIRK